MHYHYNNHFKTHINYRVIGFLFPFSNMFVEILMLEFTVLIYKYEHENKTEPSLNSIHYHNHSIFFFLIFSDSL